MKVLYNQCFGGFRIRAEGMRMLIERFPDKALKYSWRPLACWDLVRDDQEIIEFMISIGLEKFQDKLCSLGVEDIHSLLSFKISNYDGVESVEEQLDYETIICDLLSRLRGGNNKDASPITEMMIQEGYHEVMDKIL
jgi:hypothetical protein